MFVWHKRHRPEQQVFAPTCDTRWCYWVKERTVTEQLQFECLWLRDRASVLLTEGRWFDSPWSACLSVLGQETEPQTAPDVLVGTLHGSNPRQFKFVWITVCRLGQKVSAKRPKMWNVQYKAFQDQITMLQRKETIRRWLSTELNHNWLRPNHII